ncbi:hypothetical protein [uncultured Methanobrevibacter sp.]|nr:hypothetical protein [uncultured Methanobrevibacter sp.]
MDGDIVIVDGVELSKEKIKEILKENVVLRRQVDFVRTTFGGVSNE